MKCPICKNEIQTPDKGENSFAPFCSDRCRLIDLGRWLDEKYQIPVIDDDESHDGKTPSDPLIS